MNIFDFDGTIYDGDSCKDIIIYGLRKHFLVVVPSLYRTIKKMAELKTLPNLLFQLLTMKLGFHH